MFGANKYDNFEYGRLTLRKRPQVLKIGNFANMIAIAEMPYSVYTTLIFFDKTKIQFIPNLKNQIEKSSKPEFNYHGILYALPEVAADIKNKIRLIDEVLVIVKNN
jgi:hypothetical protein